MRLRGDTDLAAAPSPFHHRSTEPEARWSSSESSWLGAAVCASHSSIPLLCSSSVSHVTSFVSTLVSSGGTASWLHEPLAYHDEGGIGTPLMCKDTSVSPTTRWVVSPPVSYNFGSHQQYLHACLCDAWPLAIRPPRFVSARTGQTCLLLVCAA